MESLMMLNLPDVDKEVGKEIGNGANCFVNCLSWNQPGRADTKQELGRNPNPRPETRTQCTELIEVYNFETFNFSQLKSISGGFMITAPQIVSIAVPLLEDQHQS